MIVLYRWFVFLIYALSAYFYWHDFIKEKKDSNKAQITFIIALVSHLLIIIHFAVNFGRIPIANVSETLDTFVWITSALYLMLELRLKERSHGALILSIMLILLFIANITYRFTDDINPILYDIKFEIHVIAMLLGYSGFTLAFIASVLFLLLSREIHKRELGLFYRRLPSLVFFERISDYAINVGLLFSGIGFILGYYFASLVWSTSIYTDPKIISVLITWIIYFIHFLGQRSGKIRGQRAAIFSVVGFGLVLFSFLIISTLIPGSHQFI